MFSYNKAYSIAKSNEVNLFTEAGNKMVGNKNTSKKVMRSKNIIKAEPELFDIHRVYLASNHVEQRKVLRVFQHVIQKYYSDDYKEAINYFKNSFKKFLNDYSSPDKRLQMVIEKMTNSVDAVLESKPAQVVFEKRKTGASNL
jgi:hypothetical protein